jgi:DNA-binding MarR family transcriptional regulator
MSAEKDLDSLVEDWRNERPDIDMSPVRVFLPLRQALQSAERQRLGLLARHGVTPATLDLLVALRRSGPPYVCIPSELARSLVLTAGGVSQRLERLERSGMIERSVNSDDRRVVYVKLTDEGFRTIEELIGEYMQHEDLLLQGLSVNERAQIAKLLLRLCASIESAPEGD